MLDSTYVMSILSSMTESIIVLSGDAGITYANPATEALLGYGAEELKGRPAGVVISDERLGLFEALRHMIAKGPVRDFRAVYLAKGGERIPVSLNGSALRDPVSGAVHGIVLAARDVRDTEALIKELAEAGVILEQRVRERTGELSKALSELKEAHAQILQNEKMASIGSLAAGVAHEINNPISYLLSNLSAIEDCVKDMAAIGTGAEAEHMLKDGLAIIEESRQGAQRIKNIVEELRGFSNIDALESTLADISKCLDHGVGMALKGRECRTKIIREYNNAPLVRCNAGEINQAFLNIISNALEAMDDDGELKIKAFNDNGKACVQISDTGGGIPEENLKRIFDPFFTTKPVGKGTGLGLTIVYKIIKGHGGEVSVKSLPGSGTTFTITLPSGEDAGDPHAQA